MSCDDNYTKVPKPAAPSYTISAKPTAVYSVTAKPAAPSYTINTKPAAAYTITGKATRPTTSIVEEPCPCILCLLTESEYVITEEDGRGLRVEGAF